jgi:hypothetical protein
MKTDHRYEPKTPHTPRNLLAYSMAATLMHMYEIKAEEKKAQGNDSIFKMLQRYYIRP